MFIIEWWNALGMASQIFACMAIPATLVLVVQTVMLFLGMSGDDGADTPVDDVAEIDDFSDDVLDANKDGVFGENETADVHDFTGLEGLRIFTLRGIVAFFVVFGWMGVMLDGANVNLALTVIISFACGFAIMLLLAYLLRAIMRLRSDGNTDNRNAVGTAGKVHLTIPPLRKGEGKVHIMLQGAYVERDAVTDEEEPIPTGSEIVVIGISGQTDLVVRRK